MRRLSFALVFLLAHLTAGPAAAQAGEAGERGVRIDTPSGFPVPRFVSLKNSRTHCRQGPSFDHPVAITYVRAGLPVEVVAETTDHWRKIRDHDGAQCWTHQTTLRAVNHVIVMGDLEIRARPDPQSPARARLAAGVIASLEGASGDWRRVSVDGRRGWARRDQLWGADR